MAALNAQQARRRMKSVPGWVLRRSAIRRKFEFPEFLAAVDFVNRVAKKAEKRDHHPDIDIRWNKVTLTLSTHSEGGLTAKDFAMARECSGVFSSYFGGG